MYWNLYQQMQIDSLASRTSGATRDAEIAKDDIRLLEQKVDALALTCQAMWELLRDASTLTEEDIEQKVMEIDMRDGVADGKVGSKKVKQCGNCHRNLSSRHAKCLYCGTVVTKENVFDL